MLWLTVWLFVELAGRREDMVKSRCLFADYTSGVFRWWQGRLRWLGWLKVQFGEGTGGVTRGLVQRLGSEKGSEAWLC